MSANIENLYTLTFTGKKFYFMRPEAHDYNLEDIAHHLALVCRYGGACKFHYSVAQHSVLMAEAAFAATGDPYLALDCLFHDAAEAYIGDMKKPIKMQIPKFGEIEDRIDRALRTSLRHQGILVPREQTDTCKTIDSRMFLTEWPVLMGHEDALPWYAGLDPLDNIKIEPWDALKAERIFKAVAELLREETMK
jgi:hypothetical protein